MSQDDDAPKKTPKTENLKPPWKKGESGNPKGKKKGTLNRSTILNKWLSVEQSIQNPLTGKMQKLSQEDLIVLAQISQARKGSTRAYTVIRDEKYGKLTVPIEVDANIIQLDWNKIENEFDKTIKEKRKNGSKKTTKKSNE